MARHTLSFATSGNLQNTRARWAKPIEAAWPGPESPTIRSVGLEALVGELLERGAAEASGGPTAALLVFGPGEQPRTIDRVVEALSGANVAALCLMDDPAPWRPFQRHGILFEAWDAPPGVLAAMLYALCERQSSVELMAREVLLAQRCQGGIRTEIDRIHEELHLAASIQREFTSAPLPRVEGLEFGVLFRPVNFVSGDIYNVRTLGEGRAAFFLADAVGHGVPAALLTMVLTSSLTTTEHDGNALRILEPREVLERLNTRLCQSCLGSGRFATALYGVVEAQPGRAPVVKLAGAGHPWPLVVSKNGLTEVHTEGPLLGVFADAEFTQTQVELHPGETLLLYTDGFESIFPERPEGTPQEGQERLIGREYLCDVSRLVGAAEHGDLTSALHQIELLLDEQSGSLHQSDDVTALAIAPVAGGVSATNTPMSKAA
jgi:sigma-B regulation protein RsbU (phosphoserine phosphatase)